MEPNIDKIVTKALLDSYDLKTDFEDKIQEYGLSKSKACALLGLDRQTVDEFLSGEAKNPPLLTALKLSEFLELDLENVVAGVLQNQRSDVYKSLEDSKKAAFIAKNFDLKTLSKIGFFNESEDVEDISYRLFTFFNITSFKEYEQTSNVLFSKTKRTFSDRMKQFWVNSAYQCFAKIANPNEYDREALKDVIIKIRPYCQDVENGLLTVCKALYSVGVTVIIQNHLSLTQVRGGTFFVNGKPCIVLTDLNKRYTTIWETLLHELYHVLYDLDTIVKNGFHLTGEPDIFLIEEKAESFSREYFCGKDEYIFIKPHIYNAFIVKRHALQLEIHPSFIYSSFRQFEKKLNGKNYYSHFNEFFPNYLDAIKNLNPITWLEDSLVNVSLTIRQILQNGTEENSI